MEFAIGQRVWYLYDYDPTLNWVEGIVTYVDKRVFMKPTYNIALGDGSIIEFCPAFNRDLDRYVIRPHFGYSLRKPWEDVKFHRSIHA